MTSEAREVGQDTSSAGTPVAPGSVGLRIGVLFGPAVFGVTAAGVALPSIVSDLDASPASVAWVLTAHATALGVGTAVFGRLTDSVGTRAVLQVAAMVLLAGTVTCLVAPSLLVLVMGRVALAFGSGGMTASALTLAATAAAADRQIVLSRFGGTMAAFSASATLAGGLVTQWFSWRITVVLPVIAALALPVCVGLGRRGGSRAKIDGPGAVLLAVTVSALLVVVQAETLTLSTAAVLTATALTVAGALALAWHLRRTVTGFVPLALVRDPLFVRAAAVGAGVYGGLFSMMWGTPQILVGEHHWSVLTVGAALLPGALGGAVFSRVAGRLTGGARGVWILPACAGLAGLCAICAWSLDGSPLALIVGASCAFAAFAVTQVVTTSLMSARIPPARRGGAIGILNLAFFVGGGLGSSAAGALSHHASVAAALAMVSALPLMAAVLAPGLHRRPEPVGRHGASQGS